MMGQSTIPDMLRTPTQIIENTYNLYCNPQGKRRLPDNFVPGPYDVICARGKKAHESEGNVRFRALVEQHQAEYANCTCKHEKSKIVSYIVNSIRSAASYHQGGFVKNVDGLWFEVGDRAAKEKIGQTFRDLLHTKYSSSTKAKAKARIQKRVEEYQNKEMEERGQSPTPSEYTQQSDQQQSSVAESPSPAPSASRLSFTQSTVPLSIPPIKIPSLNVKGKFGSLRNSAKEKLGRSMSIFNAFSPDKSLSSSVTSMSNSLTRGGRPDQALSESILRSSVQTVDFPEDSMMMSTSTLQMPGTEEDWMRFSVDQNSAVKSSLIHGSTNSKPMVAQQDIDDIVDAYMQDSGTPYGIFSSSTRSNPFASSITITGTSSGDSNDPNNNPNNQHNTRINQAAKRASMIVASSISSANNPLLMASTRSSFMDMDLDGLLDGMDSMSMIKGIEEEL